MNRLCISTRSISPPSVDSKYEVFRKFQIFYGGLVNHALRLKPPFCSEVKSFVVQESSRGRGGRAGCVGLLHRPGAGQVPQIPQPLRHEDPNLPPASRTHTTQSNRLAIHSKYLFESGLEEVMGKAKCVKVLSPIAVVVATAATASAAACGCDCGCSSRWLWLWLWRSGWGWGWG